MTVQAERLLQDALKLPLEDRANVAAELLASLDERRDEGVEEAWAQEIERRARRVLAGETTGTEWSVVRDRIAATVLKK
jgi:putative addiction module component (TIGR02574 family)